MLSFLGNPPLLTLSTAIFTLLIFILSPTSSIFTFCLQPISVVSRLQLYRLFTYAFFHANFLHILFNLVAWFYLSRTYEQTRGTLPALFTLLLLIIPPAGVLHALIAVLFDALFHTNLRHNCVIGLSGALFALLVLNLRATNPPSVSIFGLFSLPTLWYPLLLALFLQLISPNLSLLAHLCGIVLGHLIFNNLFHRITPSYSTFLAIEDKLRLKALPLWLSPPPPFAAYWNTPSHTLSSDQQQPLSTRARAAFSRFTSWFSAEPSPEARSFALEGRAIGGAADTAPPLQGRVPQNSRLLQNYQSTSASAAAAESGGDDGEKEIEQV